MLEFGFSVFNIVVAQELFFFSFPLLLMLWFFAVVVFSLESRAVIHSDVYAYVSVLRLSLNLMYFTSDCLPRCVTCNYKLLVKPAHCFSAQVAAKGLSRSTAIRGYRQTSVLISTKNNKEDPSRLG